jgi:hypothetical protein
MWGIWATDRRGKDPEGDPFEIPMQGMGVFSCRKGAWPGFNPMFRGFGGEEGYIHEKFRQAGGRCLCLPWLRWTHRFGRPAGIGHSLTVEEKLRACANRRATFRTWHLSEGFNSLLTTAWHIRYSPIGAASKELPHRARRARAGSHPRAGPLLRDLAGRSRCCRRRGGAGGAATGTRTNGYDASRGRR